MSEHVLIVHGTFAAPQALRTAWYELPTDGTQNFARRLKELLQISAQNAGRDWLEAITNAKSFHWNGNNDHGSRVEAAEKLAAQISEMISGGHSRVHIVSHSHGGNVVLAAIAILLRKQWATTENIGIGRLVFLGTPFLHMLHPTSTWGRLRALAAAILVAIAETSLSWLLSVYACWLLWIGIRFVVWRQSPELGDLMIVPWRWPLWLILLWLPLHALVLLKYLLSAIRGWRERRPATNVYLDDRVVPDQESARIPALVISAGVLDEAVAGLAAAPLVAEHLQVRIKNLFKPVKKRLRSGIKPPLLLPDFTLGQLRDNIAWTGRIIRWPLQRVAHLFITPILQIMVERMLYSFATGLDAQFFANHRIVIGDSIGIDRIFDETTWDVSRMLLRDSTTKLEPVPTLDIYEFLFNADNHKSAPKSARAGNLNHAARTRKLSGTYAEDLIKLAMEARATGIADKLRLIHCGYYESAEITKTIASFFTLNQLPFCPSNGDNDVIDRNCRTLLSNVIDWASKEASMLKNYNATLAIVFRGGAESFNKEINGCWGPQNGWRPTDRIIAASRNPPFAFHGLVGSGIIEFTRMSRAVIRRYSDQVEYGFIIYTIPRLHVRRMGYDRLVLVQGQWIGDSWAYLEGMRCRCEGWIKHKSTNEGVYVQFGARPGFLAD